MPLGLDFLSQVVNVQWTGGGRFVMGDQWGYSAAVEQEKNDAPPKITNLGILDFGIDPNDGRVMGSSYHLFIVVNEKGESTKNPVFLLCGIRDDYGQGPISGSNTVGIIMASRDGLDWKRVFTLPNESSNGTTKPIRGAAQIMGVVWDDNAKAFYGCGHIFKSYFNQRRDPPSLADPDPRPVTYVELVEEIDVLMSSPDGFAWTESGRNVFTRSTNYGGLNPIIYPYPDPLGYGLMLPHCPDRGGLKDYYGNNLQDGVVHYWKDPKSKEKISICSTGDIPSIDYVGGGLRPADPGSHSIKIMETDSKGEEKMVVVDVGIPVQAVSAAGDVIIAVGGSSIDGFPPNGPVDFSISIDKESWKVATYEGGPPAVTVSGAPLQDLKAGA